MKRRPVGWFHLFRHIQCYDTRRSFLREGCLGEVFDDLLTFKDAKSNTYLHHHLPFIHGAWNRWSNAFFSVFPYLTMLHFLFLISILFSWAPTTSTKAVSTKWLTEQVKRVTCTNTEKALLRKQHQPESLSKDKDKANKFCCLEKTKGARYGKTGGTRFKTVKADITYDCVKCLFHQSRTVISAECVSIWQPTDRWTTRRCQSSILSVLWPHPMLCRLPAIRKSGFKIDSGRSRAGLLRCFFRGPISAGFFWVWLGTYGRTTGEKAVQIEAQRQQDNTAQRPKSKNSRHDTWTCSR